MLKAEKDSKTMVVNEGDVKDSIIKSGHEPYWYKDPQGYYISKWKLGEEIEIIQCEAVGNKSIAYEYRLVG